MGNDVGHGGLAEPGRAEYQRVVEGLATPPGRFDENGHLLPHRALADVFIQGGWAQAAVEAAFRCPLGCGVHQPIGNHAHEADRRATARSASRTITSGAMSWSPTSRTS